MNRSIIKRVRGQRAIDGAGVRLVRVLGRGDVEDFDPFLMLDSFDSLDPRDYLAGFPMHPHRGIETITYLIKGRIDHEDSLGNQGVISDGSAQWMTAGSGILHQEMPKASPRMQGFQLWLNLPRDEKMCEPEYYDVTPDLVPMVQVGEVELRVIAGQYAGRQGASPRHVQARIYDITLPEGASLTLDTPEEENAFAFTIEGAAGVAGELVEEKTAVLLSRGDKLSLTSPKGEARVIFFAAPPLREPIAWGGPIVMNTREELRYAFDELERGSFLKHRPRG